MTEFNSSAKDEAGKAITGLLTMLSSNGMVYDFAVMYDRPHIVDVIVQAKEDKQFFYMPIAVPQQA